MAFVLIERVFHYELYYKLIPLFQLLVFPFFINAFKALIISSVERLISIKASNSSFVIESISCMLELIIKQLIPPFCTSFHRLEHF